MINGYWVAVLLIETDIVIVAVIAIIAIMRQIRAEEEKFGKKKVLKKWRENGFYRLSSSYLYIVGQSIFLLSALNRNKIDMIKNTYI